MPRILSRDLMSLDRIPLSRTIPADEYISGIKREEAMQNVAEWERSAGFIYCIRGVKIGENSRIKILAEINDAHRVPDIRSAVEGAFRSGADIVDLGFGFDADEADVTRCFNDVSTCDGPLAIDTQDPALIAAGLFRADMVLSLHDGNIPLVGREVADSGAVAVVIPCASGLPENIRMAEKAGISCIIVDPVLKPAGSGLVRSLCQFAPGPYPLFFGAGNVVELMDADSIGINCIMAVMAQE